MAEQPNPLPPTRTLTCCCCGSPTKGRQWWNRDTGYGGPCEGCVELCGVKDVEPEQIAQAYGRRGYHWDVRDDSTPPPSRVKPMCKSCPFKRKNPHRFERPAWRMEEIKTHQLEGQEHICHTEGEDNKCRGAQRWAAKQKR